MTDITITIADALKFPEGTPIPRIVGKVTHVFDRKSGEGKHGAYTSQSGVMEQDGSKILFTIWNKPQIPEDYKGRTLIFRAGTGKKPTMTLKSDFKDATKRTLNVTASCMVLTEDEETDDIPMSYPSDTPKSMESIAGSMMGETLQKAPPKANVATKKAIPANGVQEVKKAVMQYANLREICDHAASFLYQDQQTGMVEAGIIEKIKDVSSCFFIQGIRDGLHLKLPNNKPISKKEDAEASEPDLEDDDIKF